jgi:hypothetical protein
LCCPGASAVRCSSSAPGWSGVGHARGRSSGARALCCASLDGRPLRVLHARNRRSRGHLAQRASAATTHGNVPNQAAMASRRPDPGGVLPDKRPTFVALGSALATLRENPELSGELASLRPLYAAVEAMLLSTAGGVDRGRGALERVVAELSGAGVGALGARVTVARACRELGEHVALSCHTALTSARALEPEGASPENTTPALRENARRLAVLLLTVTACETAPRRLVRLANTAIDHVVVFGHPWKLGKFSCEARSRARRGSIAATITASTHRPTRGRRPEMSWTFCSPGRTTPRRPSARPPTVSSNGRWR